MSFHTPVLAESCITLLNLRPDGVYVDATLGGGGHAELMKNAEPKIKLYCFDQDAEALQEAQKRLNSKAVSFIHDNFKNLRTRLAYEKVKSIDGILFDLGVSSHQLDTAARGFSFDKEATLDMRMDARNPLNAKKVVNKYNERDLSRIFKEYGEENAATRIARAILSARAKAEISSTGALSRIIESVVGSGSKESLKSKVRVFQALRIEVNSELKILSSSLQDAINLLKPGGRIVVLSYHSLEDRIVKNTFKTAAAQCLCPPEIMLCVCGHTRQVKILTPKPISASEEELKLNIRARSAKLRAAEKVKVKK